MTVVEHNQVTWQRHGLLYTTVLCKAFDAPGWDPGLHPRDRRGRFIETGATVDIWGGGSGTVARNLPGGRVQVNRDDGRTVTVDNGYLTVTRAPDGVNTDSGDRRTRRQRTEGNQPAPGSSPTGAFAYFATPDGQADAWLHLSDQSPVGYLREGAAEAVAYDNLDAWQRDVDIRGMTEQTIPETGNEPTQSAPEPVPEQATQGTSRAFTAADVTGNVARLRIGGEFRARPTASTGQAKYQRYRVRRVDSNKLVGEARRRDDGAWVDDQGGVYASRDEALAAIASRVRGEQPTPKPTPSEAPLTDADRYVADRVARQFHDAVGKYLGLEAERRLSQMRGGRMPEQLGLRPVAADLAVALMPQADLELAQNLENRLIPVAGELRIRASRRLDDEVSTASEDQAMRILRGYMANPSVGNYTRAAEALVRTRRAIEAAPSPTDMPTQVPDVDTDADLQARIAAYRAALPDDPGRFGWARKQQAMFPKLDLDELQSGQVPRPEVSTSWRKDRAADGGPGAETMRQLNVLRAAGADLDAELTRRMVEAGADLEHVEMEYEDALETTAQLSNELHRDKKVVWDELAREAGWDSYGELDTAADAADAAGDANRAEELRRVRQNILVETTSRFQDRRTEVDDAMQFTRDMKLQFQATRRRAAKTRREVSTALIGELRPVGGTRLDYTPEQGSPGEKLTRAMRWAEDVYPRDWLDKAKARGSIRLKKTSRGYHSAPLREIALSTVKSGLAGSGDYGRVAVHELGHEMENSVPGLLAAEEALLWDRTSTGEIGTRKRDRATSIGGRKNEKGWKDEFPDHYTGRDYGSMLAYEVFTTSIESLNAGSEHLDKDLRRWLLGTLALL